MYSVHLLGGISLEGPSGPLSGRVAQHRQLAVLALLAMAREKGLSRDKLVGYVWPESRAERARHLLADSIYLLRRSLGDDAVSASGDVLRLNADVVWTDAVALVRPSIIPTRVVALLRLANPRGTMRQPLPAMAAT